MSNLYTVSNIIVGTFPNDSTGEPIRDAFIRINTNFSNVYQFANLAYYNGLGGGGNVGGNITITNVTNFYGAGGFEGWANITTANLAILTSKIANIGTTNLSDLANALATVSPVNLGDLNNALANVSPVYLGNLANALANVVPVNLGALNNALATVNVTSLTNFTNVINSIAANANAVAKVTLVSNLSANGTANGQQVYNTTDGGLYIWSGNAWLSPQAAFTPTATSLASIEVWTTTPLPTSNLFTGRTVLFTNDNNMYIYVGGAWNNYNSYIAGSGNVSLGANSISSSSMLATNVIVAGKIAAGAITAGTIAAGAIKASEIAANVITSNMVATNAIIAGKIAAGVITAQEISAFAITAQLLAANAVYANAIQAEAITANKIAANAVTAVTIAANAVYANAIQSNSIDARMIRANAITAVSIAAEAVYANAIQSNAIDARMIRANAITAVSLAANSVYANAIQSNSIDTRMLRANIITAVQIAANSIYAGALQANVITANEIAANAITAVELAANAVYAGAIQAGAITANTIAANAITAVHVGANVITAAMIDSRGLSIRDASGAVLFSAGTGVLGAGVKLSDSITVNLSAGGTSTLGALTANATPKWLDLKNNAPGFGVDTAGNPTNQSNILLTANINGMSGTATFTVSAGTATLTATTDPNSKRLFFTDMFTDTVGITATFVDLGTTYYDTVNLYKTYQSNGAPVAYLTDETRTLPASSAGTVSSFAGVGTTMEIYEGLYNVTSNWSYATAVSGCTITGVNTNTVAVTAMSADSATVTFTASRSGYPNITKIYNLTKAKAGATGTNGTNGTPGAAGTRGSSQIVYGVAGLLAWSDAQAEAAIANASIGAKVTRDQVTLFNSLQPNSFSQARFWTGSAWSPIAAYINGGLLVNGTISANALVADSITATQIQSNTITADEIVTGSITVDKLKASTATLAAGYKFSLGYGSSIPVGSGATATTANAVVVAVSTSQQAFAGLFESKNGAPALVCGTPTMSAAYGRDSNYTANGYALEPFIAIRGRDATYTASYHQVAYLAQGTAAGMFTNYSRISALTAYTADGKHPFDNRTILGLDANQTNTAATQVTIGAQFDSYSKNTAAWSKISPKPQELSMLSTQINYAEGTGLSTQSNFCQQMGSWAQNPVAWGTAAAAPLTTFLRFGWDNSWSGVAEGVAMWIINGRTEWATGAGAITLNGNTMTAFTGAHDALRNKDEVIEVGDIVRDTGVFTRENVSGTLTTITKSSAINQKAVIGVFCSEWTSKSDHPSALKEIIGEGPKTRIQLKPEFANIKDTYEYCVVNSIGEGQINVCGENGNIEIGDYIVSSSIPGKGMKQSDDLMRNYTVAKSRENVTFSSPTEVKMIACTYHCG